MINVLKEIREKHSAYLIVTGCYFFFFKRREHFKKKKGGGGENFGIFSKIKGWQIKSRSPAFFPTPRQNKKEKRRRKRDQKKMVVENINPGNPTSNQQKFQRKERKWMRGYYQINNRKKKIPGDTFLEERAHCAQHN